MSRHAVDPFKRPPTDEEEGRLSVFTLPPAAEGFIVSGPRAWFMQVLPDESSRWLFLVAVLASVGVSLWWLIFTITDKWISAIENPQQIVTFERVNQLPALFGMAFTYPDDYLASAVIARTVTNAFYANLAADFSIDKLIRCDQTRLFYDLAFCQPTDANHQTLFHPVAGELNGESAIKGKSKLNLDDFPLQFRGSADTLCISGHLFLNQSILDEHTAVNGEAWVPTLGFVPLSAVQSLASLEHIRANHTEQTDPLVATLANQLPSTSWYTYEQHFIHFTTTKTIKVDGSVLMDYSYDAGRNQPMIRDLKMTAFTEWYLSINASGKAEDTAYANELLKLFYTSQSPNPINGGPSEISYLVNRMCFLPSTFIVQQIKENVIYNAASFISDIGGYISLLTVVLAFLFPLASQPTEAHVFLAIFLQKKWKARQQRKAEQREAAAAKAARKAAAAAGGGGVGLQEMAPVSSLPQSPSDMTHI